MLYPIYDYYHESSLTLEEVIHHYVDNFYFRKHGRDKFEKIQKKLSESTKVKSLFNESYKRKLALNNVDFGATINGMMWFMFQSNETQSVAVLVMAMLWNKNVNSHLSLKTERQLRDDALMIFKKFQIYGDMTQEEFDRMRSPQIADKSDADIDNIHEDEIFDVDIDEDEGIEEENEEDDADRDKKEAHIRSTIRKALEAHMEKTMQEYGDVMKDPFAGGMMVELAISTYFQSVKKQNILYLITSQYGIDLDSVLDEERNRALGIYLK